MMYQPDRREPSPGSGPFSVKPGAHPPASTPLSVAPHSLLVIDLSSADSQRALAAELLRGFNGRASTKSAAGEYLKGIERNTIWDQSNFTPEILPELQVAIAEGLSVNGVSGLAQNALFKIAQSSALLHYDAIKLIGDFASNGYTSARSLLGQIAPLPVPPNEIFVGPIASTIFAAVGDRFEDKVGYDCSGPVRLCAEFCGNRLHFIFKRNPAISEEDRAAAFAETVVFLAHDVARCDGPLFKKSVGVLTSHNLMNSVSEAVFSAATSTRGRIQRWFLKKSAPHEQIASLFPIVAREDLVNQLKETFHKLPASVRP